jgi:cation diffusion facilitator CzcD-associated flavoprotein CzcO
MIEKAGDFGGTWYWNRYPGAQCDIESYIYMPLLEELNYMPTEKYAHSKELLHHSEMIGRHYGLYERTLFQTEVHSLTWDEPTKSWITKTNRGDTIRSQYIIPAAGPLHRPKLPGLPVEAFKGHSFHSGRWDYNYTGGDNLGNLKGLSDKRVAIIGTGATAVQIVPHLGNWAKQVYVFQRTPSSIDVRGNRPTDPEWTKSLQKGWQLERMENFDRIVNGGIEDRDLVNDGWTDILHNLLARGKPSDDPLKAAADRQIADFEKMEQVRARASTIVKDQTTADSLKPWYNQLCKRPCFHDEYLQTFNRPNVRLVDTRGKGVDNITEKGIIANGEEFEVDCIIYATGFELATKFSHRTNMQIYGRDGMTLDAKWADGPNTLHGWTTRGFPNCFLISVVQAALSPNFLHVTGEQATHLAYVISEAQKRGLATLEPTADAEEKWVETIVSLAKLREPFLKECTPGYYNNEGLPADHRTAKGATYGAGSPAFFKLLRDWRAKGDLDGLDLTLAEQK